MAAFVASLTGMPASPTAAAPASGQPAAEAC
eukprot:CAMPEP_0173130452 /NCGR_PEP_ID=MMETSP1102-20130122/59996_1 /TAXON_ID=49646 /ORGANISM="Geminigera sp., Strain Caron Lab Isolate" /LENGTH=30 /DNA_ID= /DNA_START= /DNA_END= /DNA_ORIENTATION=